MAAHSRRALVAAAGHTGDRRTVEEGLGDADPAVRATALGAASRLGILTAHMLDALACDPAPAVRRRCAEISAKGGGGAVARLEALLDDEPAVVEAACFALGEIGAAAAPAVGLVARTAITHTDPLCREAAVAALGAIGDPGGLEAILSATADKPAVRRRAVLALAAFEGPTVDAALRRALEDRDWQVRQAAEDLIS